MFEKQRLKSMLREWILPSVVVFVMSAMAIVAVVDSMSAQFGWHP